jgi:hypothetical protein
MPGVPLSENTLRRVEVLFRGKAREAAINMLVDECGANLPFCQDTTPHRAERLRYAALKLSEGRLDKLREAVELAKLDWRDLLMAAGFGHVHEHEHWMPERSDEDTPSD